MLRCSLTISTIPVNDFVFLFLFENVQGQEAKDFIVSVVDWYPTLLSAAGIDVGYHRSQSLYQSEEEDTRFDDSGVGDVPLDGRDLWDAIQFNQVSDEISVESRELLLDLDYTETCLFSSCGAIRSGRWKFIRGAVMGVNESVTNGSQWFRFVTLVKLRGRCNCAVLYEMLNDFEMFSS